MLVILLWHMSKEYTIKCVHHSPADVTLLYIDIGRCCPDICRQAVVMLRYVRKRNFGLLPTNSGHTALLVGNSWLLCLRLA